MVLDIFALCERAELADGRLSIHRAVSFFRGQPGIAPPFDVIARLRYEPHEAGRHAFRFTFLTDDGAEMGPPLADVRAQAEELRAALADGDAETAHLILLKLVARIDLRGGNTPHVELRRPVA